MAYVFLFIFDREDFILSILSIVSCALKYEPIWIRKLTLALI